MPAYGLACQPQFVMTDLVRDAVFALRTPWVSLTCSQPSETVETDAVADAGEAGPEARRAASVLLRRMHARLSERCIRFLGFVLGPVWRAFFATVHVDAESVESMRDAVAKAEAAAGGKPVAVLYLPAHKSHLDYLLISYVCFANRLPVPFIAAGDNLNLPVVGPLLRRSGAFFIRRAAAAGSSTIAGLDPAQEKRVYEAVLRGHVRQLLLGDVTTTPHPRSIEAPALPSLEFFIEGGRSRDGKLCAPKLGLLSFAADLVASGRLADALAVPAALSYDALPDQDALCRNDAGHRKEPETVLSVLRSAAAVLAPGVRGTSAAHVRFGQPRSLRAELQRAQEEAADANSPRASVRASLQRATSFAPRPSAADLSALAATGSRHSEAHTAAPTAVPRDHVASVAGRLLADVAEATALPAAATAASALHMGPHDTAAWRSAQTAPRRSCAGLVDLCRRPRPSSSSSHAATVPLCQWDDLRRRQASVRGWLASRGCVLAAHATPSQADSHCHALTSTCYRHAGPEDRDAAAAAAGEEGERRSLALAAPRAVVAGVRSVALRQGMPAADALRTAFGAHHALHALLPDAACLLSTAAASAAGVPPSHTAAPSPALQRMALLLRPHCPSSAALCALAEGDAAAHSAVRARVAAAGSAERRWLASAALGSVETLWWTTVAVASLDATCPRWRLPRSLLLSRLHALVASLRPRGWVWSDGALSVTALRASVEALVSCGALAKRKRATNATTADPVLAGSRCDAGSQRRRALALWLATEEDSIAAASLLRALRAVRCASAGESAGLDGPRSCSSAAVVSVGIGAAALGVGTEEAAVPHDMACWARAAGEAGRRAVGTQ